MEHVHYRNAPLECDKEGVTVLVEEGWMARGGERRLSRAFKLAALARMAAGENVGASSRELGVQSNAVPKFHLYPSITMNAQAT